jgi:peptide deformylase
MKEIVQNGHPALRQKSGEVPVGDIVSKEIQQIIHDMQEALLSQDDGVAIAAPQIAVPLRIFVVSGTVFTSKGADREPDQTYINPKIIKLSHKKESMEEGCLSVRGTYGHIKRHAKTTVEAYNEHGEKFTKEGEGLLSQIFQHETNHLDGILFIDNAEELAHIEH